MSTIDYAVRGADGTAYRASFGVSATASADVSGGMQISLNLKPEFVEAYSRQGEDLHVVLINGKTLILEGFYDTASTGDKTLFLSEEGRLFEVQLSAEGDAILANYDIVEVGGKWSSFDDLVFLDLELIEPVVAPLAAPLLGGLGAAGVIGGGAVIAGATVLDGGGGDGGGDGGDDPGVAAPTVDDPDLDRVIGGTGPDSVVISGTGEPDSQVEVTIGGVSQTVIVDADGIWQATFDPAGLPDDGIYDTEVTVTDPDGTVIVLDGPMVDIDTTAPMVAVDGGVQSTGDLLNAAGHTEGATITGTGEVGAAVSVEINGTTHTTTIAQDGTWSVTFDSAEIATGEYNEPIIVTATDARGNSTSITETLVVDTIPPAATIDTVAGDDVINASEAGAGVTLTGTGEAGTSTVVEFQGVSQTVTVGADGTWAATYAAASIAVGTYDSTVTITATDAAGNTSTAMQTVHIDTENAVSLDGPIAGDAVINAAEANAGVTLTGSAEPGASVLVTMAGVSHTVTAGANGSWSALFNGADIPAGEYDATVTVTSTDTAGNTASSTGSVHIDTVATVTLDAVQAGDNIINATEAQAGVTLTGTAEAGSSVVVTMEGVSHTVTAGADGTWSTLFNASDIPGGEYDAAISVTTTDSAGNTANTSGSVHVDTMTSVTLDAPIAGDDVINAAEASAGVTLTGTAQAGSSVLVTLAGVSHTVTAAADGSWSTLFAAAEIPGGEYDAPITVEATDTVGNVSTTSGTVHVDTVASVALDATQAGDNIINAVEAQAGVTLTGTAEAGSSVVVTLQGVSHTVTAGANGTWNSLFTSTEIPSGEYDAAVTVSATDQAGNSETTSGSVRVDTNAAVALDSVQASDNVINNAEAQAGVALTGTAQPGSQVSVTLQGVTHSVTADASGIWTSTFNASEIPGGEYDAAVTVVATDPAGNSETTSGTVHVDTTTTVSIAPNQAGGDNIVNAAEAAAGVTLTGSSERGSQVQVSVAGVSRTASVDANGNWSALFEAGSLPGGEYDTAATVTSTDAAGNSASASSVLRIDTVAGDVALSAAPVELDDVINAVERDGGVEISGIATPGLTVTVGLGTASHQVVANANGNWTTTFAAGEVPTGTSTLPITASITDSAGNSRSVSDTVQLDTVVDNQSISAAPVEGDDVINLDERADGVTLTGTTEPGSTVAVQLGNVTHMAAVDAAGNWSVNFAASDIPTGEYTADISVTATDPAGNVNTLTDTVQVDTLVRNLAVEPDQTADDIVNAAERLGGVTLTGTTEPGSSLQVEVGGVTHTATVDNNGNWTATFTAAEVPPGTYTTTANVTSTDAAGNTGTTSTSFQVDTEVDTPNVDAVTFIGADVGRISTEGTFENFSVNTLDQSGQIGDPSYTVSSNPVFGTEFTFHTPVPDGTHLVVNAVDIAGNSSSTLLLLEDNATNAGIVDNAGLAQFDIHALNLDYAVDTSLALTESQIQQLAGNSDTLTIHGGADDTITVTGAVQTGATQTIDGQTYEVYTIGNDGTTLQIEQDINVII